MLGLRQRVLFPTTQLILIIRIFFEVLLSLRVQDAPAKLTRQKGDLVYKTNTLQLQNLTVDARRFTAIYGSKLRPTSVLFPEQSNVQIWGRCGMKR